MHLRYLNLDENGRETYGALVLWCFDGYVNVMKLQYWSVWISVLYLSSMPPSAKAPELCSSLSAFSFTLNEYLN